jgi:hypothetical protein
MSKLRKVRFVVSQNGNLVELFAVGERRQGDLVIVFKNEGKLEVPSGEEKIRSGSHFSIHRSPKSAGFTTKHTLNTENGAEMTVASFRLPTENTTALRSFLLGATVANYDYSNTAHSNYLPRQKDKVIQLATDNQKEGTLIYLLFVDDQPRQAQPEFAPWGSTITVDFEYFRIIIVRGVIPVFSLAQYDTSYATTTSPKVVGPTKMPSPPVGINASTASMSYQDCELTAQFLVRELAAKTKQRHIEKLKEFGVSDVPRRYFESFDILLSYSDL